LITESLAAKESWVITVSVSTGAPPVAAVSGVDICADAVAACVGVLTDGAPAQADSIAAVNPKNNNV
jgi:hypothetical protein